MRYAGYVAWRGIVSRESLSEEVRGALKEELPLLGNANIFLHANNTQQQHAVFYDVGKGNLNWLVYQNRPLSHENKNTTTSEIIDDAEFLTDILLASDDDAVAKWGRAFSGVLRETPKEALFQTDVYDLESPLRRFVKDSLLLLGDAAHATTPHIAKGSNMAMHDAFALAKAAESATSKEDWLRKYSDLRLGETANTLLFARHVGQFRQRLLEGFSKVTPPTNEDQFLARVLADPQLEPRALPASHIFDALWDFSLQQAQAPVGFYLQKHRASVP